MELFYNLIINPRQTIKKFSKKFSWGLCIGIFIIAQFSIVLSFRFLFNLGKGSFLSFNFSFHLLFSLLAWFISVILFHFFAEIWGGWGKAKNLYILWGYSFLPYIFLAPLNLISMSLPNHKIVIFVGILILGIWSLILKLYSLQQVYTLSWRKTIFTFLSPFLIIFVLEILGLIFLSFSSLSYFLAG